MIDPSDPGRPGGQGADHVPSVVVEKLVFFIDLPLAVETSPVAL